MAIPEFHGFGSLHSVVRRAEVEEGLKMRISVFW